MEPDLPTEKKSKHTPSSPIVARQRRDKVKEMIIAGGKTYKRMAQELGVSHATIEKDAQYVKDEIWEEYSIDKKPTERMILKTLAITDKMVQSLIHDAEQAELNGQPGIKIKATSELAKIVDQKIRHLQSLGILRSVDPEQTITIKYTNAWEKKPKEVKEEKKEG